MLLTEDKLLDHKKTYEVYRKEFIKKRFEKEEIVSKVGEIEVMLSPVQDEVSIEQYGQDVESMLQFIYYGSLKLKHKDMIMVDNLFYEIISILKYNEYQHIKIRKVT